MGSKNKPGTYDCYANAHPDEPMFVLLGRDERGPALVRQWADISEKKGTDPAKVAEARTCADNMERWRESLQPLRIWKNIAETYVARTAAHATRMCEVDVLGAPYDVDGLGEWKVDDRPLDTPLTIDLDDGRGVVTQTLAAWIAENPNGGMLCSSEV